MYNAKLEARKMVMEDLSEDGCPHLGGQAEAVEQPWAYDEEVLIEMEKYKFLLMVAFTLELMMW